MTNTEAREVIDRFLRLTADGPNENMADLFAEDAAFEMPYLPPGAPLPAQGREAFRAHLKSGKEMQKFDSVQNVNIYETIDPQVVVAEYRLHGSIIPAGSRFAFDLVMIARVRDGLIVWSRNYANPLAGAIAFGRVAELMAGLTA